MRPPLPPSNTATKTPNLPAPRQADRLPSTMAALAAIPEEEIWLQKQKSALQSREGAVVLCDLLTYLV
jgi:hypothetical protein